LLLPAAALIAVAAPVLAAQQSPDPQATTTEVPVAPAGTTVEAGWQSDDVPVSAQLVGVQWEGATDAEFSVEVQGSDGTWTPATSLGSDVDGQADPGTKDAARSEKDATIASEPVWIGEDAQAVRVTLQSGEATGVSLAAVETPTASAPSGSAGAVGTVGSTVGGIDRLAFASVVFGIALLLVLVALGWSPWRGRRTARVLPIIAFALMLVGCVPVSPPPPPSGGSPGALPGAPPIIGRAQWGARPFACGGGPEYASYLKSAIVHHTVNSNNYSPANSAAMVRGIQAYHMDANGYCDIAYHFVIDRYGQIFEGRAGGMNKPVIGGHAGGFNTGSTGIALLGDNTSTAIAPDQWNALVSLLRWRLSVGRVDPSRGFVQTVASSPCNCMHWPPGTVVGFANAIVAHRDVDQTGCPGNAAYGQLQALRDQVQAGISIPPAAEVSFGSAVPSGASGVRVLTRAPGGGVTDRVWDGSSWSTNDLGGVVISKVEAVAPTPTTAVVMARDTQNHLAWRHYDGTVWSPWASAGGQLASDPAAAVDSTGLVHVVARFSDGAFWRAVFDGTTWSAWTSLGGGFTSDPAVAVDGSDHLVVVGRGLNLTPYWGRVEGVTWSGWSPLVGQIATDLSAITDASGAVRVFGIGTDWVPYTGRLDDTSWSGWGPLGGIITSDLGVGLGAGNEVALVGRGSDDRYYVNTFTGSAWSGWSIRGGMLSSDPALVRDATGRLWLFGRGIDNSIYVQQNDGSGWSGWTPIGGQVESIRGYG